MSDSVEPTAGGQAVATRKPLRTQHAEAPLLVLFTIPVLVICGLVVLIGSDTTWLWVGIAIACIAVMTLVVLAVIGRLVDDGGGSGH
jgi:hypothetical protein